MKPVPVASEVLPHWLNQTAMAASLGISVQAFKKWEVQPVARVGKSLYYVMADVLRNRLDHELSKLKPEEADDLQGFDYERYRLTKAQADSQELKNAVMRKELAPVDLQTYCLSKLSAEISGTLDSIPLDHKRKHPEASTLQIENLKRSISKAMSACNRLSENIPEYVDEYLKQLDD